MNSPSVASTKMRSTAGAPSIENDSSPSSKPAESAAAGDSRAVIAPWRASETLSR
jgi:hypothetical protein